MKLFLHICISLLLVLATTGFTLHQHYCGEKLMNSGLEKHTSCCSDGPEQGSREEGSCCNNTANYLGSDHDFQGGKFSASIALLPAPLSQIFLAYCQSLLRLPLASAPLPHFAEAPPLHGTPYLASLCTLLI